MHALLWEAATVLTFGLILGICYGENPHLFLVVALLIHFIAQRTSTSPRQTQTAASDTGLILLGITELCYR